MTYYGNPAKEAAWTRAYERAEEEVKGECEGTWCGAPLEYEICAHCDAVQRRAEELMEETE